MITDFLKKLTEDSVRWVEDGLIDSAQRRRILDRYLDEHELEQRVGSSRLVSTLSVMGAIMVGVGIILFIASNWSEISKHTKVAIIMGSMIASYAIGWWLRHESAYPKVGAAVMLLGSIIYGAGIFLIAQVYNVSVHYPNGLLFWWVGVLPLAYLLRLSPMLVLSSSVMLVWLGSEADFRIFGTQPLYKFFALYMLCGVCLWELGLLHRRSKDWLYKFAPSLTVIGLTLVFGAMFLATFNDFFEVRSYKSAQSAVPDRIAMFYWAMGLLTAASMTYRLIKTKAQDRVVYMDAAIVVLCGILAVYFGLFFEGVSSAVSKDFALASNILYAFFIFAMIVIGYFKRSPAYINLGLVFFAIDITARYFDYFWKLLPRSMFFVFGGLLLLVGGVVLERNRRKVLGQMDRSARKEADAS